MLAAQLVFFLAQSEAEPSSLKHDLLHLLSDAVGRRRLRYQSLTENYLHRIDHDLNKHRINILLFSWGETHEPPAVEWAVIGSHTIVSLDTAANAIDLVSWTHDIRAPEVERRLKATGKFDDVPKRIDEAYGSGGLELMREVVEDATGLAIDGQIIFSDLFFVALINRVFEQVEVDNPKAFLAHPIYFQKHKYPMREFPKGRLPMNGETALQYIKSVTVNNPDKTLEHSRRKERVFAGIRERSTKGRTASHIIFFLRDAINQGLVSHDLELEPSLLNFQNLRIVLRLLPLAFSGSEASALIPTIRKSIYVVDPAQGDGGVQWARANAAFNPFSKRDLDAGLYPKQHGWEIPYRDENFFANPDAEDLVIDYWLPMRERIKELLTT